MINETFTKDYLDLPDEQLYKLLGTEYFNGSELEIIQGVLLSGASIGTIFGATFGRSIGSTIGGISGSPFKKKGINIESTNEFLVESGKKFSVEIKKKFQDKICSLNHDQNINKIEIVVGIATIISAYLSDVAAVAGAVLIVRAGLSEYCKDWKKKE